MTVIIALVSALVMVWSGYKLVMHNINEHRMGSAIRRRIRGYTTKTQILGSMFREPFIGLSKEAKALPEQGNMMRSYWLKGLYGLIFIVAPFVFSAATGFLT